MFVQFKSEHIYSTINPIITQFHRVVEPTSLKLACSNGLYEVVEAMISAGVDVNTEDSVSFEISK